MKVSYRWLSKYVDLTDINPYQLAEKLTNSGVAVDIVEKRNKGLEGVVVGFVLESIKHPDAEKLNLCTVDVGQETPVQIVCGASNVAKGQKVPVALVGASLPGDVKIKKAKLRGVTSEGMICSAKELGLNEKLLPKDKAEGILVLPNHTTVGENVEPILGFDDYILELDLTPNRSDCLSMIGVAYEVATILNKEIQLPADLYGNKVSKNDQMKIDIQAQELCKHYASRLLKDVKIAESPLWLQNILVSVGIRPINNVVDVTNYVLMEYGQPLHAFDFDRLEKAEIVVRTALPGEKMVTLDDQERELDEQMLLITDGVKPIAIAGVMGGANSEVTRDTTSILIESAYFAGSSVRRTSKKLGLRSEASLRFEKGVDPNRIYLALNRATELLVEIAGARVEGDVYEAIVEKSHGVTLTINAERVNKFLGTALELSEMEAIFKRLRFEVTRDENDLEVVVPTRRQDIAIEADLYEEIARIYGYDAIPTTLPEGVYIQGGLTEQQRLRRNIKNVMEAAGLQEVITYSFTNQKQQQLIKGLSDTENLISLAMPLSEERELLRTALIPNLIEVAQYNMNRRNYDVRIYEMGTIFISNEEKLTSLPDEKLVLAGLVTGSLPKHWQPSSAKIDFYHLKGMLEELFTELGLTNVNYLSTSSIKGYHPGRTAEIRMNNEFIGYLGQLHPAVQEKFDLKETYVFELNISKMLKLSNVTINYKPLPKYPAIQRDIALVVEKTIEAKDLMNTIYKYGGDLLEDLSVFDVYISDQLGKDKKSIALSLIYRSMERTLTDEEVTKLHEKVLRELEITYQAELRK